MDKHLPPNAGNTGLIPVPGGFYRLWSNEAHAPQLLKPTSLEPVLHNKTDHRRGKPEHHKEEQPHSLQLEKPEDSNEDPVPPEVTDKLLSYMCFGKQHFNVI